MVCNEILITFTFCYKLVSIQDECSFYISAYGEGSDEPACMHDLARALVSA